MIEANIPVFLSCIAQKLVKEGYQIVDLAPNRRNIDETVFYFKNEKGLEDKIKQYLREFRN